MNQQDPVGICRTVGTAARYTLYSTTNTLPETNMAPENGWLEWNTSFLLGWPIFRGYVSFRECRFLVVHEPLLTLRSNMRSYPQIGGQLHEKMMEVLNEDVHVDVIPSCKG